MGLASGTQIGPYEIAALLGAGGMGEVYRAVDTRLGRQVAIKVLVASSHDSDRLRRFKVETRTVSSLQHANILALYDVGDFQDRPFLVSELLQGETLRDLLQRSPLEPAKAVDLAVQLCHGLAAAHDKGIVHRDIKPENLFITREGVLKILDFGIAKRTANETSRALEKPPGTVTENTETGTVLGTAGYMSPEQVRGQAADRRSDLFSAGAVLYEMLTGQRAFQRASTLETAYAIVKDEPEELPPSVPTALAHIVRRCLEKQPDDRFQSSRELAAALEASRLAPQGVGFAATEASASAPLEKLLPNAGRKAESGTAAGQVLSPVPPVRAEISRATRVPRVVRVVMMVVVAAVMSTGSWFGWRHFKAASAAPRIMMAVLPFEDFTGDSQKEYFADGLTEGMISQLGRLQPERLAVIARTSVNQYRHTKKSIKEIGSELGVQYVLECSVQRVDDRMRVDAQLIHTSDQTQLWSDSYEREIKDVLVLQSEVARAIAAQVRVKLSSEQAAGLSRTRSLNPAAYDAYLRGDYFRAKASEDGIRQAMTYFEQATKLDPGYAVAYAGLAGVTAAQPVYDVASVGDSGPPAKAAALRALALDDGLADAHAALAHILLIYDWDWPGAERHYRRAIELDPNNAATHSKYAIPYLASLSLHREEVAELERAVELSPLSLGTNMDLGEAYGMARQYDRAIAQLRRTIELDPANPRPHGAFAWVYEDMGRYDEAFVELEKFGVTVTSDHPDVLARLARCHARAGHQAEARRIIERAETLARTEEFDPYAFIAFYAAVGRRDDAFALLEKAYKERAFWLVSLRSNARFASLRDDPRFADLVRRIGIPEPSQTHR